MNSASGNYNLEDFENILYESGLVGHGSFGAGLYPVDIDALNVANLEKLLKACRAIGGSWSISMTFIWDSETNSEIEGVSKSTGFNICGNGINYSRGDSPDSAKAISLSYGAGLQADIHHNIADYTTKSFGNIIDGIKSIFGGGN